MKPKAANYSLAFVIFSMAINGRWCKLSVLQLIFLPFLWQCSPGQADNNNSSYPGTQSTLSNSLNQNGQTIPNATSAFKRVTPSIVHHTSPHLTQLHPNSKPTLVLGATPAMKPTTLNDKNITIIPHDVRGPTKGSGGLEFWVYLLIAVAVVLLACVLGYVIFNRVNRWTWKDSGSYMVWNDNELQLSPAFTRESEFLLDNLAAAEQALQNPDLQIYEIPLDSVIHNSRNSIYSSIGGKRVAPEREHNDSVKRKASRKEPAKRVKKKETQVNISSSSGRTSTSVVLSEGSLDSTSSLSRLPKHKSRSKKVKSSTLPRDNLSPMESEDCTKRSRSGSHLLQDRPLPETPVLNMKRFSKSLDKLRFFNTLPGRTKANVFARSRPLPIPPLGSHPPLVKSASIGSNVNNIVNSSRNLNQAPSLPPRRASVDAKKPYLTHRHSKSLDTLLLLKDLDLTAVDIAHSYESVHGSSNSMESPYASVDKRSLDITFTSENDHPSSDSRSSLDPGLEDLDVDNMCNVDHPYACVSDHERSKLESFTFTNSSNNHSLTESEVMELSSVNSTRSASSGTLPYASVRISQIPGCESKLENSLDEQHVYSGEVFENLVESDEYSSANSLSKPLRPNSHGYTEILPCEAQEVNDNGTSDANNFLHTCADANQDLSTSGKDSVRETNSNRSSETGYDEILPSETVKTFCTPSKPDPSDSNTYLEIIPDSNEDKTNPSETTQYDNDTGPRRHSYLEILPDRSSIVSETSSGYARPIDIVTAGDMPREITVPENMNENIEPMNGVYDNVANMVESDCDHLQNSYEKNAIKNNCQIACYDNLNTAVPSDVDKNANTKNVCIREPSHVYDNLFPAEMDNMGYEGSDRSSPARFDKVSDVSDHEGDVPSIDVVVHRDHSHAYSQREEESTSCA